MSSVSNSGGGGALYQDGSRVQVQVESGETVEVPEGETWIVDIYNPGNMEIAGATWMIDTLSQYEDVVLHGGDSIRETDSDTHPAVLRGWSV